MWKQLLDVEGGGAGGILGWIGGLFGMGGESAGPMAGLGSMRGFFSNHDGGLAGVEGRVVMADPAVFSFANRYHYGGLGGLKPDEVPAVLQRYEEILPVTDPRHRWNGGRQAGGHATFIIYADQNTDAASIEMAIDRGLDRRAEEFASRSVAVTRASIMDELDRGGPLRHQVRQAAR